MNKIKLLIAGSRGITKYQVIKNAMDYFRHCFRDLEIEEVIHGGAIGVDSLAEKYCKLNKIKTVIRKPDWKLGRGAGIIRNREMVLMSDFVLVIWDGYSKGTRSTIDFAVVHNRQLTILLCQNHILRTFDTNQLIDEHAKEEGYKFL